MERAGGRVEARIKLATGQGLWPAFWMLGARCPEIPWPDCGEIDVMENKGSQPTITSSAAHGPGYSGNTPFAHTQTFAHGTITDFHIYAAEWDSTHVQFFVDGVPHYAVTREQAEHFGRPILGEPFFLIINLAVGGHFDGDPQSDSILPATMLVDYVRVYTLKWATDLFIHAVYFWLRPDLSEADRRKFEAGLRSLRSIDGVAQGYIGRPAATDRPVIERGYTRSLVLVFADESAQEAYQVHPVHDDFRDQCGRFWTTVRIYDSVTDDLPK
jgi:hypothetical protein